MSDGVLELSPRGAVPSAPSLQSALESYLGAARVLEVEAGALRVVLEDDDRVRGTVVRAVAALAFPYACVVGDSVLVVGDPASFYVIGVLRGSGRISLSGRGEVGLQAEGHLRLAGDRGVRVSGERISVEAGHLRRLAGTMIATFGEQLVRVRDTWDVGAAQVDELSEGRFLLQARRIVVKTLANARIRGAAVRLG